MTNEDLQLLSFYEEPELLFNYKQPMIDPRDGLTLFGPLDRAKPEGIRWSIVGPQRSIEWMKRWLNKIQQPIYNINNPHARPYFPGFESIFRTKLSLEPAQEIEIPMKAIESYLYISDGYQRVHKLVELYASKIISSLRTEDVRPDIWFVLIPHEIYLYCRPKSHVPSSISIPPEINISRKKAKLLSSQLSLIEEYNVIAEDYLYEINYHHQLKAMLLHEKIPTQIIRDVTIAPHELYKDNKKMLTAYDNLETAICWNLATAIFYKAGGRPWKLGAVRKGVCYIGLVFKKDEMSRNLRTACCGAQMFLDSGDGVVFKGAVGPWYKEKESDFHLDKKSACDLVKLCISSYIDGNGVPPTELFIHGRTYLNNDEWSGFVEGAGNVTKVIGIRIRKVQDLKLFRKGNHPILRGLAYHIDNKRGYLWTEGMVPRLLTYPGREVPNPLSIDICRGVANIHTVMADILALTKLNYNSCSFGDSLPVTLKFANAVGEILTSGPSKKLDVSPLPFKFYI